MYSESITSEQLEIQIHHVGGIGGYGPAEVLDNLGHVHWIVYDTLEDSLSATDIPAKGRTSLVNKTIGGTNERAEFHVTRDSSASSLLSPAGSAANYTLMLRDGSAREWGPHAEVVKSFDVDLVTLDSLIEDDETPAVDFLSIDAQGAELMIINGSSRGLKNTTIGVLCEVEFAALYEGQALFCDIQDRLR